MDVPLNKATDPVKQQGRVLKRLLRDLIVFTGVAAAGLSSQPRKSRQMKRRRILYRRGELSDADLEQLVTEVGIDRVWRVLDRLTQPQLPLQAAE
jgi:hypothetical protein